MRFKEGNKEKKILDAAVEVFAEMGFHKARIQEIAKRAGVAVGSVYVYYASKEELLLKIFENIWEPLYWQVKKISEDKELSYAEKFDYLIDVVFDAFIEEPSKALVFVNEQNFLLRKSPQRFTNFYELFVRQGERIFKKGVKEGVFNEMNISIFRRFILGGLRDLLLKWTDNPKPKSLNSIRESVKAFCKSGIIKKSL